MNQFEMPPDLEVSLLDNAKSINHTQVYKQHLTMYEQIVTQAEEIYDIAMAGNQTLFELIDYDNNDMPTNGIDAVRCLTAFKRSPFFLKLMTIYRDVHSRTLVEENENLSRADIGNHFGGWWIKLERWLVWKCYQALFITLELVRPGLYSSSGHLNQSLNKIGSFVFVAVPYGCMCIIRNVEQQPGTPPPGTNPPPIPENEAGESADEASPKNKKKSKHGSPTAKIFKSGEAVQFIESLFEDEDFRAFIPEYIRKFSTNDLTEKNDGEVLDSAYEEIVEASKYTLC